MIALSRYVFLFPFYFFFFFLLLNAPLFFFYTHAHTHTHSHRRICTVPYTFIIFRNWNAKLRIYWGVRSSSRRSRSKWKWKWTCVLVWVSIEGEKERERERKKKRTNQIKCCRNRFFLRDSQIKKHFFQWRGMPIGLARQAAFDWKNG